MSMTRKIADAVRAEGLAVTADRSRSFIGSDPVTATPTAVGVGIAIGSAMVAAGAAGAAAEAAQDD